MSLTRRSVASPTWSRVERRTHRKPIHRVETGEIAIRDLKHLLAWEIVSIYHGDQAAHQAAQDAARMHVAKRPATHPAMGWRGKQTSSICSMTRV